MQNLQLSSDKRLLVPPSANEALLMDWEEAEGLLALAEDGDWDMSVLRKVTNCMFLQGKALRQWNGGDVEDYYGEFEFRGEDEVVQVATGAIEAATQRLE